MSKTNYFKRFFTFLLVFIFFFSYAYADDIDPDYGDLDFSTEFENALSSEVSSDNASNNSSKLNLNSRSCIVLDRKSKYILYEKKWIQ